jgi:hypothetical protein
MLRGLFLITFMACLLARVNVMAQPSFSIEFQFRLFDEQRKLVDINKFCSAYSMLEFPAQSMITICNDRLKPKEVFYDSISQKIRMSVGVVYVDANYAFVHKTDTMLIKIVNSGYGARINIDSLAFTPGYYAITCSSRVVNGKTLPDLPVLSLKQIDFPKSRADYYNLLLQLYLQYEYKKENYVDNNTSFRKLQRRYRIPQDDLLVKTPEQLMNIK